MHSIDQNQTEQNHADLTGPSAVERIRATLKHTASGFLCTNVSHGGLESTRPMTVQQVDDRGTLFFLSAADSHQNLEITRDPSVRLFFQGSEHSGFLTLAGTASISRDKAKIQELWKPVMKTWFTGGLDDPRITVIAVSPSDGYYWDNKHGNAIAAVKILLGAALGKTLDDSIQGKVSL